MQCSEIEQSLPHKNGKQERTKRARSVFTATDIRHMQNGVTIKHSEYIYPTALRKAKILYYFGLSECNRVKSIKN